MKFDIVQDLVISNFQLKTTFKFNNNKKFHLFPFLTNNIKGYLYVSEESIGNIICNYDGCRPDINDVDELYDSLLEDVSFDNNDSKLESEFKHTVKKLFCDKTGQNLLPLNIRFIEFGYKEEADDKFADFLSDVLGTKSLIKKYIDVSIDNQCSNVLEDYILHKIKVSNLEKKEERGYKKVFSGFTDVYNEDFKFIISSPERIREYLCVFINFYYFMYVLQTYSQLCKFTKGKRDDLRPLYFCLDWENASAVREAHIHGWKAISSITANLFWHSVTLEILNTNEEIDGNGLDYIDIASIVRESPDMDHVIADKIINIANYIYDNSKITRVNVNKIEDELEVEIAIRYLYDCIIAMATNSSRREPASKYGNCFMNVALMFLKDRGRLGYTLNITEEMLILLTKLAIKDEEKMRLNNVFVEFEKRGVFFDDISKDCIAKYYEKLNLIEKKSDSGDSKYVRRIV